MSAPELAQTSSETIHDNPPRATPSFANDVESRAAAILRMIEAVNNVPDDPAEDDADFFRTIDAARPERPLFQGLI